MIDEAFEVIRPIIWFAEEDFRDADEPYMLNIYKEGFKAWFEDAEDMPLSQSGIFRFYSSSLNICGENGQISHIINTEQLDTAMNNVAALCLQKGEVIKEIHEDLQYIAAVIRKRSDSNIFGVLLYVTAIENEVSKSEIEFAAKHFRVHFYRVFENIFVKDIIQQKQLIDKEAGHRERLFLIAKRLYDHIDAESVVREMLYSLEELYPESEINLYLSQDHLEGDSRVQPLEIKNAASDIVTEAFLEGKYCIEKKDEDHIRLAIPMNGKQAVYGVLGIEINSSQWDESDLPAFLLIADTAGSAFENAKLYEQSNLLITELRLINDLTKKLNQSLRSTEIFKFAISEMLKVFKADYCTVMQLDKESNTFVVKASNFTELIGKSISVDYGFTGIIYKTKEAVIISDYKHKQTVPSEMMDDTKSRSLIASPMFVDGEVAGVIHVTHRLANYFSYDNYKLLQVMSSHIGLAFTNASLHAEMRKMVITDNLTNLRARHFLNEQIQFRQQTDIQGSLILVDIDFFKNINDTYGHQVGDRILIQVSSIIRSSIRSDDIAARWGGEELAIYLPMVSKDKAIQIAERILNSVEQETNPKVTVSCGISEWTASDEKVSVESLFYRADMALYEAKNSGRNRISLG